jgi:hypothetical protein
VAEGKKNERDSKRSIDSGRHGSQCGQLCSHCAARSPWCCHSQRRSGLYRDACIEHGIPVEAEDTAYYVKLVTAKVAEMTPRLVDAGLKAAAEAEEMTVPNHRERQLMQHLRGAGWVKATALPDTPRVIANLISKGWIESNDREGTVAYRLTAQGLSAKTAPVKI